MLEDVPEKLGVLKQDVVKDAVAKEPFKRKECGKKSLWLGQCYGHVKEKVSRMWAERWMYLDVTLQGQAEE
jgi:hypothetical protein